MFCVESELSACVCVCALFFFLSGMFTFNLLCFLRVCDFYINLRVQAEVIDELAVGFCVCLRRGAPC